MSSLKHLNKLKTLYLLQELIVGCFGGKDKIFAYYNKELDNALEFRRITLENEISSEEIQNIVCGYLYRTGLSPKQCKIQADNANNFFFQKSMAA